MPATNFLYSTGPGVYEVIRSGANKLIAFACTTDASLNAVWQVGRCDDLNGNNFVEVFSINTGTGEVKINGVTLTVP